MRGAWIFRRRGLLSSRALTYSGARRLSGETMTTAIRRQAVGGLCRRFGLAILVGAILGGCHHSESGSSTPSKNPVVGRWQAEIPGTTGLQQCVMDVGEMGHLAYSDSCPMPLTSQQATITTSPDGTYAPTLF